MKQELETEKREQEPEPVTIAEPLKIGGLYMDIFIVVLVAIVPDLYRAICVFLFPELLVEYSFYLSWSQVALRALTVTPVALYIMWLRKDSFYDFGFKRAVMPQDFFHGIVLFLVTFGAIIFTSIALSFLLPQEIIKLGVIEDYQFYTKPSSTAQILFFIVAILLNSISEEIIARGFLISKLLQINNNAPKAVVYSSLLFASYHIYQGLISCISIFVFGCIYGFFYVKHRKLFPLIVAHTLQNLIVIASAGG